MRKEDKVEVLEAEQWIPRPLTEVFSFFSDERNLEVITPPWLSFKVLGKSTPQMESGTLIDYRLRIHGIPLRWQSRIELWEPNVRFVDTQVRGPYALWEHMHTFESVRGGTLIRDRVRFRVPLGRLGHLLAGWKVRSDVKGIFAYRKKKIEELFASA